MAKMMAVEWRDLNFQKRQLCVQRSDWKGQVTSPKSGRIRYVPLTVRLASALKRHRHLRGTRVLQLRHQQRGVVKSETLEFIEDLSGHDVFTSTRDQPVVKEN